MACKANKKLQQSILGCPPHSTPTQNARRLVDQILGFATPMYFCYLWDESVCLPTGLTVLCLGWRAGLISLNVRVENGPTFQCIHPLTDKEAAPLLPTSAADCNAGSLCRLKGWYLPRKLGQYPSHI